VAENDQAPPSLPPVGRVLTITPVDSTVDTLTFRAFLKAVVPNLKCLFCGNDSFHAFLFYDPNKLSVIGLPTLNSHEKHANSFYAAFGAGCSRCGNIQLFQTDVVENWARDLAAATEGKE
jgi:hypothetical protein